MPTRLDRCLTNWPTPRVNPLTPRLPMSARLNRRKKVNYVSFCSLCRARSLFVEGDLCWRRGRVRAVVQCECERPGCFRPCRSMPMCKRSRSSNTPLRLPFGPSATASAGCSCSAARTAGSTLQVNKHRGVNVQVNQGPRTRSEMPGVPKRDSAGNRSPPSPWQAGISSWPATVPVYRWHIVNGERTMSAEWGLPLRR